MNISTHLPPISPQIIPPGDINLGPVFSVICIYLSKRISQTTLKTRAQIQIGVNRVSVNPACDGWV